jgi:hypothetical protein
MMTLRIRRKTHKSNAPEQDALTFFIIYFEFFKMYCYNLLYWSIYLLCDMLNQKLSAC